MAILSSPDLDFAVQSRRERLDQAIMIAKLLPEHEQGWALFEIGLGEIALGNKSEGEDRLRSSLKFGLSAAFVPNKLVIAAKEQGVDDVYETLFDHLYHKQEENGPSYQISFLAGALARGGFLSEGRELASSLPRTARPKNPYLPSQRLMAFTQILAKLAESDDTKAFEQFFKEAMYEFMKTDIEMLGYSVPFLAERLYEAGRVRFARQLLLTYPQKIGGLFDYRQLQLALNLGLDEWMAELLILKLERPSNNTDPKSKEMVGEMSSISNISFLASELPPTVASASVFESLLKRLEQIDPVYSEESDSYYRTNLSTLYHASVNFAATGRVDRSRRLFSEALSIWEKQKVPKVLGDGPAGIFRAIGAARDPALVNNLLSRGLFEDPASLGRLAAYVRLNGDDALAARILNRTKAGDDREYALFTAAVESYHADDFDIGDEFAAGVYSKEVRGEIESFKANAISLADDTGFARACALMEETEFKQVSEDIASSLFFSKYKAGDWSTAAKMIPYLIDEDLGLAQAEVAARVGDLEQFDRAFANIETRLKQCVSLAQYAQFWPHGSS